MPKNVRRILFVDHTAAIGGGEIALLNLVGRIDSSRYKPVVLLLSHGPLEERLAAASVETHVLPMDARVVHARKDDLGGGTLLRLKDVRSAGGLALRVAAFIRREKIDLVHTNSLKADLIGGAAARAARLPLIWHVRDRIAGDYLPDKVASAFAMMSRIIPDRVIAISQAVAQTLGRNPRVRVIHDGTVLPPTVAPSNLDGAIIVGLVGRISPWKGQDVFIRAAGKVRQRFPQARFQIIGSALFGEKEYEGKLAEMVQAEGLNDAMEFTGFRSDAAELIAHLSVLVHASTTGEPFGQVVIEGMAAGKPVVATNGGAIPEIVVEGQTGRIVPMGDDQAMATAICDLLADPAGAAAMGLAGRRRVMECFTIEQTAERVQALYDQMLGGKQMTGAASNRHYRRPIQGT